MKNKINLFFYKHGRRTVLDAFADPDNDSSVRYEVVRRTYPLRRWSDTLNIEFKNNGSYIYSSVYTSSHRHFQPVYEAAQKAIAAFFRRQPPQDAIVLGCAGCTIPRFVLLHYKQCETTGIEYSAQLVDIADRYFISKQMRPRFELINDDAFSYIASVRGKKRYSLVYTDIYTADIIHPQVFTNEYTDNVFDISREESVAVINTFRVPLERTRQFVEQITAPFDVKYIIEQYRKYYIVLVRTSEKARIADFEKHLPKYAQINMRITDHSDWS